MKLQDTIEMMNSSDFKDRFKAEYWQLKIRMDGLAGMLIKWDNNMLNFTPKCQKEILENQLIMMKAYAELLELRAKIEGVELY